MFDPEPNSENGGIGSSKRKRRPAGTPDPDADVVSLSPKTLLESDRYVCEICNQGFQRDQNLQMHRRRHKVPWKLLKRETPIARKRVFVCPEPSCLHHDPCHALGDLVGIKKHFRRKHSNQKQWVCEKCSKGYAVQSDYKAHLKTCGTRGHSCDCGRVFSRVESFIEHQDACSMGRLRSESHHHHHHPIQPPPPPPACLSRTASSPSPSSDTNHRSTTHDHAWTAFPKAMKNRNYFLTNNSDPEDANAASTHMNNNFRPPNLELQLLTKATSTDIGISNNSTKLDNDHSTQLQLSIGSSEIGDKAQFEAGNTNMSSKNVIGRCSPRGSSTTSEKPTTRLREEAQEELRVAMAEKAYAEEARQEAKRQMEIAEHEFSDAKRIRQQAQAEMEKAQALREHATKQMNSTMLQITCHSCKHKYFAEASSSSSYSRENNSLGLSYISAALREWKVKK